MSIVLLDPVAVKTIFSRFRLAQFSSGVVLILFTGCISDSSDRKPWNVNANCSSNVTSISATTGVTSPYYNGYRLISETYSYEKTDGTTYVSTDHYSYSASSLNISISNRRPSNSSFRSSTNQTYDNNGYLTGGSRFTSLGASVGGGHSYVFSYGDEGQLLGYDINQARRAAFIYSQGRLDAINIFNEEDEINDTITYRYDDESNLVSALDSVIDVRYAYRCNSLGQITDVYTTNIYSDGEEQRSRRYEVDYDDHGNLITIVTRFASGSEGATYTYEYEQTDELVFNHWLLRLSTGFVWTAANLVD